MIIAFGKLYCEITVLFFNKRTFNGALEHLEKQNFLRRPTMVGDIFYTSFRGPSTLNCTPGPMHYLSIFVYCKIHDGEHSQKLNIEMRHNVLSMISSENFAVPLYTQLLSVIQPCFQLSIICQINYFP